MPANADEYETYRHEAEEIDPMKPKSRVSSQTEEPIYVVFFHLALTEKEEIGRGPYGICGEEGVFHWDVAARLPPGRRKNMES